MRQILLFSVSLVFCLNANSQELGYRVGVMPGGYSRPQSFPEQIDTIAYYQYTEVEKILEPIGGWNFFHEKLSELEYPAEAKKKGEEIHLEVYFAIDRFGELTDLKIKSLGVPDNTGSPFVGYDKATCKSCEVTANRLIVERLWVPAKINGINVNSTFSMTLMFSIYKK